MDRSEPRYVVIRKMLCRACEELAASAAAKPDASTDASDRFVPLDNIKAQIELYSHGDPVEEKELLEICETEGNHQNGGGSFDLREDQSGKKSIRWDSTSGRSNSGPIQRAVGAPGEIGSPIVGGGAFGSGR